MQSAALKIREDSLRDLARNLVSDISALDPSRSDELISNFLLEFAVATAEQRQKEQRRQKQAEGIAAAKARGVRFGRRRTPLPDDFDKCRQAWRNGEISLREAAESCGMEKTTFQRAAIREEQGLAAQ